MKSLKAPYTIGITACRFSSSINRAMRISFLVILASVTCKIAVGSTILNGVLTTADFLADDSVGTFYYDLYQINNPTLSDISVSISLAPNANMLGYTAYWTTNVLPASNWASPINLYTLAADAAFASTPGEVISMPTFTMAPGATFQLAIATADYNEDNATLGSYELTVGGTGLNVSSTSVPEPTSTGLLLSFALVGLCLIRKFATQRGN